MKKSIKNILAHLLTMAVVLSSMPTFASTPFVGSGTADDPYQIATTDDLVKLGELTNVEASVYASKHYILTNDLDMSGVEFDGICERESTGANDTLVYNADNPSFSGTFDGDGHIIENLTVNRNDNTSGNNYTGLFCWVTTGAVIKNLGLVSPSIEANGAQGSGCFIGYMLGGTIESCFVKNVRTLTSAYPNYFRASFAGRSVDAALVKNCYVVNGTVNTNATYGTNSGDYRAHGTVENVYAVGTTPGGTTSTNVLRIDTASNDSISAFITASNGAFVADTNNTNSGYPLLAWENEGEEGGNPEPGPEPEPEPEPEPSETTNEIFTNGQGNGTKQAPYQISTTEDLVKLGELTSNEYETYATKHYILTNDLDMTDVENFKGICAREDANGNFITDGAANFAGTFDGNEHVIKNLIVDRSTTTAVNSYTGLFGWTGNAVIKNLGLVNVEMHSNGSYEAGGLVGRIVGSTSIENCFVRGVGLNAGSKTCGGLVGNIYDGVTATITNCYTTDLKGSSASGGLSGSGAMPRIVNFYSTNHIGDDTVNVNTNVLRRIGSQSADTVATFIENSDGSFKKDTFSQNNGLPVVAWENEMVSADREVIISYASFDNTSGISGKFTVKNCNSGTKTAAVGVVVYGENNKMLGAKLYEYGELESGQKKTENVSFSDITNSVSARVFVWDTLSKQGIYQVDGIVFHQG